MNSVMIPEFGVLGAAAATLAASSCAGFFFHLLSRKTRPIFLLQLRVIFLR
jgi:Na+-driven multidrug efflux pump